MIHPTRRGVALFALGLAPALLPALGLESLWTLWLGWGALAMGALAVDALRLPRLGDCAVDCPPSLYVGRAAALPLTLQGPPRATVRLDLSANGWEPDAPEARVEAEGGAVTVIPARRGAMTLERIWARYEGPLGLVQRTASRPLGAAIEILPDAALVREQALRVSLRGGAAGVKVERFQGEGTEFEALREFTAGMDTRTIDWRASARHGSLMAREYRAERNHQIVLALDTGRRMSEPLDGLPRLDHAIHAALQLGWVGLRGGDRVALYDFADRPGRLVAPRGGQRAIAGLIQASAALEYRAVETNYTLGLTELLNRLRRRSLVIVMTDFEDTIGAELMVENLGRLAKRHLVVFVALQDPLLPALIARPLDEMVDVERAVVADALLQERELVLNRLRRLGVRCVDAPPAQISGALIARYLEIVRREMIA